MARASGSLLHNRRSVSSICDSRISTPTKRLPHCAATAHVVPLPHHGSRTRPSGGQKERIKNSASLDGKGASFSWASGWPILPPPTLQVIMLDTPPVPICFQTSSFLIAESHTFCIAGNACRTRLRHSCSSSPVAFHKSHSAAMAASWDCEDFRGTHGKEPSSWLSRCLLDSRPCGEQQDRMSLRTPRISFWQ